MGDRVREVSLERRGARVVARVDGREYRLSVHEPQRGIYSLLPLEDGGPSVEVQVSPSHETSGAYRVRVRGRSFEASAEPAGSARRDRVAGAAGEGRALLRAVMPGRIVRILVHAGEKVTRGQGIIVVEAMKMENELTAPKDGTVIEIRVAKADRVEAGAPLVVIE